MLEHQSEFGIVRLGALTLFDIRGYISMDAGPAIKEAYGVIDPERAKKILLRVDEDTFFNSDFPNPRGSEEISTAGNHRRPLQALSKDLPHGGHFQVGTHL
jgi:hypothetical protein